MIYGVCGDPDKSDLFKEAGFDFMELNVQSHLSSLDTEEVFLKNLEKIHLSLLPCIAANCFLPGSMKITGSNVDLDLLYEYSVRVFRRARVAGIKIIVFGSGGARNVPDGFDRRKAFEQIVEFCEKIAKPAEENGITVVLEPLNIRESNILNTVKECADVCCSVSSPAIRLLVDFYHFSIEKDNYDALIQNRELLGHVHIATVPHRKATGFKLKDFSEFASVLKDIGYNGSISIEGSWDRLSYDECLHSYNELKDIFE